jgi:GT2 family glycosyltransferase
MSRTDRVYHLARPVTLSIVIPAHQAADQLPRALEGISKSSLRPLEVLVVDDGSTDETAAVARAGGARVERIPDGPRGPAAARNYGAALTSGDVLVFLDADVVVHPDALSGFERCLAAHPDVAAVFGSYDDRPDDPGLVSRYRNLLHHFVHQQGLREASTFWAGCGAIRRAVFVDTGGFDERYRRASIEDIELGGRLRASGHRVWLRPEIQATHLKRWTFWRTIRSDVMDRAIPWTRLILRSGRVPRDLNTSMGSRLAALAAWTASIALPAAVFWPPALAITAACAGAVIVLNRKLYALFVRKLGWPSAAGAAALHALYLLYSSAVFGILFAAGRLRRRRGESRVPDVRSRQVP